MLVSFHGGQKVKLGDSCELLISWLIPMKCMDRAKNIKENEIRGYVLEFSRRIGKCFLVESHHTQKYLEEVFLLGTTSHNVSTTFRAGLLLWRMIEMAWEERIFPAKDLWKGGDAGSQFCSHAGNWGWAMAVGSPGGMGPSRSECRGPVEPRSSKVHSCHY